MTKKKTTYGAGLSSAERRAWNRQTDAILKRRTATRKATLYRCPACGTVGVYRRCSCGASALQLSTALADRYVKLGPRGLPLPLRRLQGGAGLPRRQHGGSAGRHGAAAKQLLDLRAAGAPVRQRGRRLAGAEGACHEALGHARV